MHRLVLSGWAQPADALLPVEPDAQTFDYSAHHPDDVWDALAVHRDAETVVAWSMGGQLALRAIARGILHPRHLTLLAVPYQFVSSAEIRAMDPLIYQQFRENYTVNAARTKTRFHGLVAKGDRVFSDILGRLRHHEHVEQTERWLPWLEHLAEGSLAQEPVKHAPPTLIVHGDEDAIVPVTQAALLAAHLPGSEVQLWEGVGHAPHLHNEGRLRREIVRHRQQAGVA